MLWTNVIHEWSDVQVPLDADPHVARECDFPPTREFAAELRMSAVLGNFLFVRSEQAAF